MNIKDQIVEVNGVYWPKSALGKFTFSEETLGIFSAISPFLRGRNTVVQAGGNCGVAVKQFVNEFKNVYTFEPDPVNFFCLNLNLPYTNVFKFQSCLGNEHKLISTNNWYPDDNGAVFVSTEKTDSDAVPVLMIDDLNLQSCDAIVLDVEGYEYNVLKGAAETINKFKPVLCMEKCLPWMERYSVTEDVMDTLMNELGYKQVSHYRTSLSLDVIYAPN